MTYRTLLTTAAVAAWIVAAGCGGAKESAPSESAKEGGAASTASYFKVDPATAATITGKVTFTGKAPVMRNIDMSAEPDCAKLHAGAPAKSEEVVVNPNGTLQYVFVYVKSGLEGKTFEPPATPVKLDQKGCVYHPHVFGVQVGQKIDIANSDPTTHNIHPMPKTNREWNQSQAPGTPDLDKEFSRPEVMIPVKCNVHPWMRSYIGVVDNPYFAVTNDQGTFELKNLPPGTYTLEAWHEKFGTQDQQVTVAPSATQTVDFSFKGD
ncbi:MAG TPA: carboxypeptidase regulatory-like domain-containing protein [Terriglobales bacterium]|jgi:plastocyanin|nr:carboxypeptidase regulatory-like domain-containing protein [Terriglobales bacterium]